MVQISSGAGGACNKKEEEALGHNIVVLNVLVVWLPLVMPL